MRLPGDEGQGRSGASVVYTIIGVAVFVLAMVFVLLKSNDTHKSGSEYLKEMQEQEEEMAEAESEEEPNLHLQKKRRKSVRSRNRKNKKHRKKYKTTLLRTANIR